MIRVLVVDDSPTVRARLAELIDRDPDLELVGEAGDGRRAVELAAALRPDVITLDIVMPEMTGLEATEHIMAHQPTPILIVSASFNRGELFRTYDALSAGAVDVLEKPGVDDLEWDAKFTATLKLVSKVRVIMHPRARLGALGRTRTVTLPTTTGWARQEREDHRRELVAIGASTGGPAALVEVLGGMSRSGGTPILVVLHLGAPFATSFADWLSGQTRHDVRFACDGDRLDDLGGVVVLAPPDTHTIVTDRRIRLVATPPRHHCRPSIDVLFESLAAGYGPRCAAALLTGMGRDGATGLLAIRRAGGVTLAQDEESCVVYGMPREAMAIGAAQQQLPLSAIASALELVRARR